MKTLKNSYVIYFTFKLKCILNNKLIFICYVDFYRARFVIMNI